MLFAGYDPADDQWRDLAQPPFDPLLDAQPVWTGRGLLAWGGSGCGDDADRHFADGAALTSAASADG